jgi:hexokinase
LISKDLFEQVKRLEELFDVPTEKLKTITAHFVKELEKGLSVEGGNIVRINLLRLENSSLTNLI